MYNKKQIKSLILVAIMVSSLAYILVDNLVSGTIIESDDIDVDHESTLSGKENLVEIQSEFSVQDVKIYLNDTLAEYKNYDPEDPYIRLPQSISPVKGHKSGDINDLEIVDGQGVTLSPKYGWHYCPVWSYYSSKHILTYDTSLLEKAETSELRFNLKSEDEFKSKIYYYEYDTHNWRLLNEELVDNSEVSLSIPLTEKILENPNLKIMLLGYNKHESFTYLLDQAVIIGIMPSSFEDDLLVDVRDFDDGEYIFRVDVLDYEFNLHRYTDDILVDNTAPIIEPVQLPEIGGTYNDTDIINFEVNILDISDTKTIISFELNGSEYITLDFDDSTTISYQNTFLPGIYSYIILSEDSTGLADSIIGTFEVLPFEELPVYIYEENIISINIPDSVHAGVANYPVYIEISGNQNYDFEANLTYIDGPIIDTALISTNNSDSLISNVFNETIVLNIFAKNDSDNLVFSKEYTIIKYPPLILSYENSISISVPSSVNYTTTDYPIQIDITGSINYLYEINISYTDDTLIDSTSIFTNNTALLNSDVFNNTINLKIFNINKSEIIIDNNYYIEKIPKFDYYHIIESEIAVSVPSSVNEHMLTYPISIEVTGNKNFNYYYELLNDSLITASGIIVGNDSIVIISDIFNSSFNFKIFNLNHSNEIVFNKNFTIAKMLDIEHYNIIEVNFPLATSDSGYDLEILAYSDSNDHDFEYRIYISSTMSLISTGSLVNGAKHIIYLDVLDELILVQILERGEPVYNTQFSVEEIEEVDSEEHKESNWNYNLIFVAISIAGLMISAAALIWSVSRDNSFRKRITKRHETIIK